MSPSAWPRRIVIAAIALAGAVVSAYLAAYQLGAIAHVWDPYFGEGSQRVLASSFSLRLRSLIGVPDALLGVIAYATEIILVLAGSHERWRTHPRLVLLFGLDVLPLGVGSIALVLMQASVIHAFCTLCLVSAVASLTIVVLAHAEVIAAFRQVREARKVESDPDR